MVGVIGTGECSTDATEDTNIVNMSVVDKDAPKDKEEEERVFYKEAFDAFDWNRNGTIPTSVSNSLQFSIEYRKYRQFLCVWQIALPIFSLDYSFSPGSSYTFKNNPMLYFPSSMCAVNNDVFLPGCGNIYN